MGSQLIFIIPVIRTKENAVSFKSALSGVHQVQTPLPEPVKGSVLQPISQSQKVWGGWCCCDWSTAFWNREIAGNLQLSSAMSAGWTPVSTVCAQCFPKCWAWCWRFKAGFEWVKWEIKGVLSLRYTVIPACLDNGDDSVTSKQCWDDVITGFT